MIVVKLYDKDAHVLHIGTFNEIKVAEEKAKKGLKYSHVAVVYDGDVPLKLFDNGQYTEGFPLGVGSY
ncbi:hypothetical protein ACFYKX_01785 [Cytobacillus sp. FJAT-54145]|uniref:Uncharacterized protein n=1 Tax=Cytobacillus spartinae TaxID=3299023 RepID=A0ABW6K5A8_9BACI